MTRARKAVLDVLACAEQPLSAAAVHESLAQCCDQVTVYRTLHYLEKQGKADSFVLHCSAHGTERYYTASVADCSCGESAHRHWFHCEQCHRFIDLGTCRMDDLLATYEDHHGFAIRSHTLNLVGVCAVCLAADSSGESAGPDVDEHANR